MNMLTMTQSNRSRNNSARFDVVLEGSRQFMIDKREFTFDEKEAIFFMLQPTPQKINKEAGCNTCGAKWEKISQLKDSHCQFCGISNCKVCLHKTRPFCKKNKDQAEAAQRGKCCKLCDRKFHIRDMITGSLALIKTQNLSIDNSLRQTKKWQLDMADAADQNRQKAEVETKKISGA